VWKVLRDTDGERFVATYKGYGFSGDFVTCKIKNHREEICLLIETFLYVIIYPLALELFAFRKNRCKLQNKINLRMVRHGPPQIDLGVAKKNPINIMRLPR
jgi:hypothetical protein